MSLVETHQFLVGGNVSNFLAPPTQGYHRLSFCWSGMWQAHVRGGRVSRGLLLGSLFHPFSPGPHIWKGPRGPQERRGGMVNSKGIPSTEPAQGRKGWHHLGVHLGSTGPSASFQHMHHTHTCPPQTESHSPRKAPSSHVPVTSSLQAISSRTYWVLCLVTVTRCNPWVLGQLPAHLSGLPILIIYKIQTKWKWTEDCGKGV